MAPSTPQPTPQPTPRPTSSPVGGAQELNCADGVDNDLDGFVDCADADCDGNSACFEDCTDGLDNDIDGFVDCADADCLAAPACQPTDSPTSVPTPAALVINGMSCPYERVIFEDPDPTLSCDPGTDPDGATCKAAKIPAQPPFPSLPIPLAWCTYAAPGPKKCVRCVPVSPPQCKLCCTPGSGLPIGPSPGQQCKCC